MNEHSIEPKRIRIGNRLIDTCDKEIVEILMMIRDRIYKGSDIPHLLEEHIYLFKDGDPVYRKEPLPDLIMELYKK